MFQMQYLLPDGFPAAVGQFDREVNELASSLKNVDKKWVNFPNSAIRLKLNVMLNGASLEIKKRDQLVYINLFCVDTSQAPRVLAAVQILYNQYNLGPIKRPTLGTWIHSVPVAHHLLRENEIQLCQKLTVCFFWAVFGQELKRQNSFN